MQHEAKTAEGLLSEAAAALKEHGKATQAVAAAHGEHAVAVEKLAASLDRINDRAANGLWLVLILFVVWMFWRKS